MMSLADVTGIEATPALVVDLAVAKRNVLQLAEYATKHSLGLRPHTKTHKSRVMARLQAEAGVVGLTAAKVGEAEVMAEEHRDILVAYPIVDPIRCRRLAALARREVTVRVAMDSAEGVSALADACRASKANIGVLVDLDVGFHRTGVQSPEAALELARLVVGSEGTLRLDGLFFYPGHIWAPREEQAEELRRIDVLLAETIGLWSKSGLSAGIVSGGSTPTTFTSHLVQSQSEIRPGTYIYNDMNTVRASFCSLEDCAAGIVCTVVSTAVPGKAVIDAGTKTLTSDRNARAPDSGHGYVVEYPEAKIMRLSEEHGELDLTSSSRTPRVGERVTVIPNHICPCVNLQDQFWVLDEKGRVEARPVDTRGRLS